jgi:hypothetical protein
VNFWYEFLARLNIPKLPTKLLQIQAMLRCFPLADEDHRNIPPVALLQDRIGIYIHFSEFGAEFAQEWRDGRLSFIAQVASTARIESNVTRAGSGKTGVFGMIAHRLVAKSHHTEEQAPLGRTGA